jgi:orotidine-5'-phosphate decarboxylase
MDRLIEAISAAQNPSIVGLDPTPVLVPPQIVADFEEEVAQQVEDPAEITASQLAVSYFEFNRTIIDAVADIVPAVKPQIAMYEALGPAGIDAYTMTCEYAQQQGLYVLGDVKRGDIGSTAAAYAAHLTGVAPLEMPAMQDVDANDASALNTRRNANDRNADNDGGGSLSAALYPPTVTSESKGDTENESDRKSKRTRHTFAAYDPWHEDAVTVNPYLGVDGITPFVNAAERSDKDLFVLVRTSNPSSSQIQELDLAQGGKLYEHVADHVEQWGASSLGTHGYSRVGAVVGATHAQEGRTLRQRMPHTFFLVPGFGAQGGTAQDVAGMFDENGSGAIVNSSRGIIGAWRHSIGYREDMSAEDALRLVAHCARQAALDMRDQLRMAVYR